MVLPFQSQLFSLLSKLLLGKENGSELSWGRLICADKSAVFQDPRTNTTDKMLLRGARVLASCCQRALGNWQQEEICQDTPHSYKESCYDSLVLCS